MGWNTGPFVQHVMSNAADRLRDICVAAVAEAKTNMRRLGGPSEPYHWPGVDTQSLQNAITYEISAKGNEATGYFGVLPYVSGGLGLGGTPRGGEHGYPYWLEVGTVNMKPRPWMTFTMDYIESRYGVKFERHV